MLMPFSEGTMNHKVRRKMVIGEYPRHLLVRVKQETFHRLHERAARNNRSLNLEMNEIISHALKSEKGIRS